MDNKQQQSLNEAIHRVVYGEPPSSLDEAMDKYTGRMMGEEKETARVLKMAVNLVNKAIASLHKKHAKDLKKYGIKGILPPKGGKWKSKKNKGYAGSGPESEYEMSGGDDWIISTKYQNIGTRSAEPYVVFVVDGRMGGKGHMPLKTFEKLAVKNWYERVDDDAEVAISEYERKNM